MCKDCCSVCGHTVAVDIEVLEMLYIKSGLCLIRYGMCMFLEKVMHEGAGCYVLG